MTIDQALAAAHAAFARGDFAEALAVASRCVAQEPSRLEAHALRVNAALKREAWGDAIPSLRVLIAAQPDNAQFPRLLALCLVRIGNALRARNQLNDAAQHYLQALSAHPPSNDARFNLGMLLLESTSIERAVQLLDEVRRAEPDDTAAALGLAEGLIKLGRDDRALAETGFVASRTDHPDVLLRCAELFADAGGPDAALDAARRSFRAQPTRWWLYWKLAGDFRRHGYLDVCNALLDDIAATVQHPLAQFRVMLGRSLGLPLVYRDAAHLLDAREGYLRGLDRLVVAYPPERVRAEVRDATALAWDNFFLAYQGHDDRVAQERYGDWLSACLAVLLPQFAVARTVAKREQPRIALVSSFFRTSTVGSYFHSWVEALAGAGFEVVLFQLGPVFDEWTARYERAAGRLVRLGGEIPDCAAQIRAADADLILYPELGMDSRVLALAALRLAPRQACAWGHPTTTGLPTIDAYFSCADMEPPGAQEHYRERLILLPGLGTRYASPQIPPPAARGELGLPDDARLYLAPQSPFKLHPDGDAVLIELLASDPAAIIVLFDGQTRGQTRLIRERLERAARAQGLDPGARFRFFPVGDRAHYLRVVRVCDVMIDSPHWSGGNTTLDALHVGLPVVTWPGRLMRGRQSMAMLRALGCAELIVEDPRGLAERAMDVARDRGRRAAISQRIRARLPELVSDTRPLQALVAAVRGLCNDEVGVAGAR